MHPVLRTILITTAGALVGGLAGYVSQCTGGSCPLFCVPWRGAVVGAVFGLLGALQFQ